MRSSAFTLLRLAAAAAEQNREHDLRTLLARVRSVLDPEADARDMLAAYYLAGLSGRVEGHRGENIYLRGYDQPQIDLFRLLTEHLPFVRVGMLANAHLLDHLRGHAAATVLSIGIGQGHQEGALLAQAAAGGLPLRRLVVIGVDPAADSLAAAEINLKRAGAEHGIEVTFHAVPAATEELDEDAWTLIGRSPRPLLATASFALHHMVDRHPGQDARDVFLHRLRALAPAAVALCEPDSDHHRASLPERFANSWRMFGTLFEAIDATPLTRAEQDAMKSFFGREIIDIVGAVDERSRYERHEPTVAWLRRLRRCGFRTTVPVITPELERTLAPSPDFTLSVQPDHVRLGYRQDPLVSMMAAIPASAASPDPEG
ncbi:GAI protein2C [Planomonospora sp. ID91781]|uniref:GRAS family protein n=1 Tax=Planomonospora sp. ID91781 TaxID=2738135 RepID=UPI0018C364B6|nr:GRAS family protein [Planomonospora sp. ID91781]MBG0824322.1 GAI protein2C [Planomonospora sp. ID91781]